MTERLGSGSNPDEPRLLGAVPERVTFTEEGTITSFTAAFSQGTEPGEAKQIMAETFGTKVSDLNVFSVNGEPHLDKTAGSAFKKGKSSAAFSGSKWNSPWDPHADKKPKGDPNQN